MTELEWLKQESGMSDDELKAMETVAGAGKFKAMLLKMVSASEQSKADVQRAENERLALEKRYNEEFLPEMRKVTTDSIRAQGEAARMKAELDRAREYGIVPEGDSTPAPAVRAPGSPDPSAPSFDAAEFAARQSRAIITLNDLNAEHFKLFKEPLPNSQALVDRVQREHTLGHRDYTIQKAWEEQFNVPQKRAEMTAESQRKHDDEIRAAALKEYKQSNGDNPMVRSGQPSRFSTYKPSDAAGSTKPWQVPAGSKSAARTPWREASKAKLAAA
jgi:hypothetical protein